MHRIYRAAKSVVESLEQRVCLSAGFTVGAGSPISVGSHPAFVVEGDFNGDGTPELAVANRDDGTVTILFRKTDGSYTPATGSPIAVGTGPTSLAVGDFNGDGKADLAIVNSNPQTSGNTLTLLLGNGNATFTPAPGSPIAIGNHQVSTAAMGSGDFNADGKIDLVVTNPGDNTVSVFLGDGDGTFVADGSPIVVGHDPVSIAAGDLNGDGGTDLAVANADDNTVTVLLANPDGTFTAATGSPFPVGHSPSFVQMGDFNSDHSSDLVVSNTADNTLSILFNDGTGSFTSAPGSPISVGHAPGALGVADYNGDGMTDIAVINSAENTLSLLSGSGGNGAFIADGMPIAVGSDAGSIASGILSVPSNLVESPDLVVANTADNSLSVLLNATPKFSHPSPTPSPKSTDTPIETGTLGVFVVPSFFDPIVTGIKATANATVTLTAPAGAAISGKSTIAVYMSAAPSLDGATHLASVTVKLKLKAGAKKIVRVKLPTFDASLVGLQYLIASATAPDASTTAVAGAILEVAAPVITVKTSSTGTTTSTIAAGKRLTAFVTLENLGNIPSSGRAPLTVSISLDPTGVNGQTVATTTLRVKLKPNQTKTYFIKLTLPKTTTAGSYFLAASLDVAPLGDLVPADGDAVSTAPLIVN